MKPALDLRRLRYFVAIAELGSVTRAARSLHLAQPALSQHVGALERELGVRLLDRGPRGVVLTEAGARLEREARALLANADGLLERVRADAREPEGEVVLGISQSVGIAIGAALLRAAAARLPGVHLQVRELISGLIPDLLRTGALDFALAYEQTTGTTGIDELALLSEELFLVGRRDLAKQFFGASRAARGDGARTGEVPFAALAGLPLYLSRRGHVIRDMLERIARRKRIRLTLAAEVDSLYLMRDLARGGSGFCVLSWANVHREAGAADLWAARLVAPALHRDICLLRRHGQALPRAAREVALLAIEMMAREADQGAWRGIVRTRPDEARRRLG